MLNVVPDFAMFFVFFENFALCHTTYDKSVEVKIVDRRAQKARVHERRISDELTKQVQEVYVTVC